MEGLTDIHCHMLPHVDDGARSEEEAMAMLKAAYADGIRTIILTPHFRPERWKWTAGDFLHAWESLAWKAKMAGSEDVCWKRTLLPPGDTADAV